MVMTGALSVVEPGSPRQLMLATMVMLMFSLTTLKLAPYRKNSDDWMSFVVSLAITIDTQIGFVLLMDEGSQVLNAQLAETLLLFINVSVFIIALANVVLVKMGVYEKVAKSAVCLTCTASSHALLDSAVEVGISRGLADDSEREVEENSGINNSSQSIVHIVPVGGEARTSKNTHVYIQNWGGS